MKKRNLIMLTILAVAIVFNGKVNAQTYTLTDDDVVVINGEITSCSYSFELTDIVIPEVLDGQTVIGIKTKSLENAVFYAKGITSVHFPTTIKYIGGYAFCFNQIQVIDFSNCPNLEYIGWYAFTFNETIKSINFSSCSNLEIIDDEAFSANDIKEVDLSDCINLKTIGYQAFLWNGFLSDVNLEGCASLVTIGWWAFSGASLSAVDLSSCTSLVNLGLGAFDDTQISNIVLPTPEYPGFEYWEDNDGTIFYAGDTVSKVYGYNAKDVYTPVTFTVTNDGSPIDSATIDFYNGPYTTNELGLLELSNVLQGSYTYTVSAEGFADAEGEIFVGIDSVSVIIEMSEVAVTEIPEKLYLVYPNPGTNQMIIDFPTDSYNGSLELYNNEGKLVLKQNISFKPTIIQCSKLNNGIYFFRIFDGERLIKSGKWVKE